jgi:hypothetical protein
VAGVLGFEHRAAGPALSSPLAGYGVRGLGGGALPTIVAGSAGTLAAFALAWLLAFLLTPRGSGARGPGAKGGGAGASRPA